MSEIERVTVSLPDYLVRDIDRQEKNRSKFVAEAVRRELDRRRRAELRRSLRNPHQESEGFSDQGFEEWARNLPVEDADSLVDATRGKPIRWVAGKGWRAGEGRS
jgi:Arc/MetJ-type ribon-helix-helix transcriptional regulator